MGLWLIVKFLGMLMEKLPKIIFLAIYNQTSEYNQMYEIHKRFFEHAKQVNMFFKYYFVMFTSLGTDEYMVDEENHMLYINGTETFIPGILDKTIKAFHVIHTKLNISYDFIFRTNISTFVHFKNTYSYLTQFMVNPTNKKFYIGPVLNIQWFDEECGIIDKRYWGTKFCSGTCMIMNYFMIEDIINHREQLLYTLIDDVAIGKYVMKVSDVCIINILPDLFSFTPHNVKLNTKHLCYMNNFNKKNREVDIFNLNKISNLYITRYVVGVV